MVLVKCYEDFGSGLERKQPVECEYNSILCVGSSNDDVNVYHLLSLSFTICLANGILILSCFVLPENIRGKEKSVSPSYDVCFYTF